MELEPDLTKVQAIRPAVSAVIWRERKLLLHRRSDNGRWGLPGGSVEIGESVSQAVVREVEEETGLKVEVRRLIGVYSDPRFQVVRYPDGRTIHYITVLFECVIIGGRLAPSPETLELQFFDPQDLPPDLIRSHAIRIMDALKGREGAFIR